jgi:hypothetical protein
MIYGWISRDKYLEHHDPAKWAIDSAAKLQVEAGNEAELKDPQPVS